MYGMIHKAARELAVREIGEEAWARVLNRCGLDSEHFISGQHYTDDVTFLLIEEIASELDLAVPDLLREFGRYWIHFAEQSAYAPVLDMCGDDLATFLVNLDRMHSSIRATLPEAVTPSFAVTCSNDDRIDVAYRSSRTGLEAFVSGLLEGLLRRFEEQGAVSWARTGEETIFTIDKTCSWSLA